MNPGGSISICIEPEQQDRVQTHHFEGEEEAGVDGEEETFVWRFR